MPSTALPAKASTSDKAEILSVRHADRENFCSSSGAARVYSKGKCGFSPAKGKGSACWPLQFLLTGDKSCWYAAKASTQHTQSTAM